MLLGQLEVFGRNSKMMQTLTDLFELFDLSSEFRSMFGSPRVLSLEFMECSFDIGDLSSNFCQLRISCMCVAHDSLFV